MTRIDRAEIELLQSRVKRVSTGTAVVAVLGIGAALYLVFVLPFVSGGDGATMRTMIVAYGFLGAPSAIVHWHLRSASPLDTDDAEKWHKALDVGTGILTVVLTLVVVALCIPSGSSLGASVKVPLVTLATVGALYSVVTTFRPEFHGATRQRLRRRW